MTDGKLTTGTITPAYGRDYTSGPLARADFENGKDFILHAYGAERSGYVGRSDFAQGARIIIRYGRLRKTCVHIVGQAPMPPRPRKAKRAIITEAPGPAPVSYRVDVMADDSGKATGNRLRFATALEARTYGQNLAQRWTLVRSFEVLESGDDVNAWLENGEVRSK